MAERIPGRAGFKILGCFAAVAMLVLLSPQQATGGEAAAGSAEVLALADYYLGQDRLQESRALVVELLKNDPSNLAAHRFYIKTWRRVHQSELVVEQYRAWFEEQPDDELRRLTFALAYALDRGFAEKFSNEDCQELQALLEPLPKDPERRYLALARLSQAYKYSGCPGDLDKTREEIRALRHRSGAARRHFVASTSAEHRDEQWLESLQQGYKENAQGLHAARALWDDDEAGDKSEPESDSKSGKEEAPKLSDEALAKARQHALSAARKALRTKKTTSLSSAYRLFQAAGDKKAVAKATRRLLRLDPQWKDPRADRERRKAEREQGKKVRDAARQFDAARRLKSLDDVSTELPETGAARVEWHQARAKALFELGRDKESIDDYRKVYEMRPEAHYPANTFAWQAALAGVQLEAALVAVDAAIRGIRAKTYRPSEDRIWQDDYEQWSQQQARTEASYLDTRAWLLYKLERYEDAVTTQRAALRLHQTSELHRHMGLIYARAGDKAGAVTHLAEGIRADKTTVQGIEAEAIQVFEDLFPESGIWHPDGAQGHLKLLAAKRALKAEENKVKEDKTPEKDEKFSPGTPFPDLTYKVGEKEHKLSELGGTVLIDMWATWCGPCVKGLPHLDEVARKYKERGLTTLALSVDFNQEDAEGFFDTEDKVAFAQGWSGEKAMDTVGIRGIPAVFILDEDLKIEGYISGYSEGDRRIEAILDKLLNAPE